MGYGALAPLLRADRKTPGLQRGFIEGGTSWDRQGPSWPRSCAATSCCAPSCSSLGAIPSMPAEVVQAAVHSSSMEDEARDILRSSLNQEPQEPKDTLARRSAPCSSPSVVSTYLSCPVSRCGSYRPSTNDPSAPTPSMKARAAMRVDHHRAHVGRLLCCPKAPELLPDQRTQAGRFSLRRMVNRNRMISIPLEGMPA